VLGHAEAVFRWRIGGLALVKTVHANGYRVRAPEKQVSLPFFLC
jgi:hypothetical protein